MSETLLKMILAGVLFGCWPLLMNKSGLTGMSATAVFCTIVMIVVVPFAITRGVSVANTKWWFAIASGCCGAIGLLCFNSGLTKATPETVGKLFVTMLVVQTAMPALYHVVVNHQLNLKTATGFVAAIVAAILLV